MAEPLAAVSIVGVIMTFSTGLLSVRLHGERSRALQRADAAQAALEQSARGADQVADSTVAMRFEVLREASRPDQVAWVTALIFDPALLALLVGIVVRQSRRIEPFS
ncbi:MAG: hypothetical protein ACE5GC_09445 [Acidimicrobiia bacterium]